jgi:two-component system phosphate regulon sensor histidine kinase PhoR
MDRSLFKQKKFILLVLLLVLLPIIYYSVYEISSLNENEQIIQEVYQHQMNLMLYTINKSAWDICNDWITKLNQVIDDNVSSESAEDLLKFLEENNAIRTIIISDSLFINPKVISSPKNPSESDIVSKIINEIQINKQIISRLYARLQTGYRKIESLHVDFNNLSYKDHVILLSLLKEADPQLLVLLISTNNFIDYFLRPVIWDASHDEFNVGIFREGNKDPLISTDYLDPEGKLVTRRLWIFPDHYLAISLKSFTIENMAASRFKRSLLLIGILGIMLIIGAVFLYRNIQHEMEIARLKSEFVSNVSHELRTPLSIIRMFAETIELNRLDSDQERIKYSKIIGRESERLAHIIENFLDISRLEAGQREYKFESLNLNEIVTNIFNIYRFHIENRGFNLDLNLSDKKLVMKGDKESLAEVLINLFDNSMKYSEKDKYIAVRTLFDNGKIILELEDKGIGIPEEALDRIFNKFYRVPRQKGEKQKGAGLGLTLVKSIVDVHGGEITVTSKPGAGSCFRILFNSDQKINIVDHKKPLN